MNSKDKTIYGEQSRILMTIIHDGRCPATLKADIQGFLASQIYKTWDSFRAEELIEMGFDFAKAADHCLAGANA